VNLARELARGRKRHGSCGMGIGETSRYALDHLADAPRAYRAFGERVATSASSAWRAAADPPLPAKPRS
jgi:hypothetical protein